LDRQNRFSWVLKGRHIRELHWQTPDYASALSEARLHESVKAGELLCARSIEPFALKVAAGGCGGCGNAERYGFSIMRKRVTKAKGN
jgi:hypothetical protein